MPTPARRAHSPPAALPPSSALSLLRPQFLLMHVCENVTLFGFNTLEKIAAARKRGDDPIQARAGLPRRSSSPSCASAGVDDCSRRFSVRLTAPRAALVGASRCIHNAGLVLSE